MQPVWKAIWLSSEKDWLHNASFGFNGTYVWAKLQPVWSHWLADRLSFHPNSVVNRIQEVLTFKLGFRGAHLSVEWKPAPRRCFNHYPCFSSTTPITVKAAHRFLPVSFRHNTTIIMVHGQTGMFETRVAVVLNKALLKQWCSPHSWTKQKPVCQSAEGVEHAGKQL